MTKYEYCADMIFHLHEIKDFLNTQYDNDMIDKTMKDRLQENLKEIYELVKHYEVS